jgi:hypothetical protein
LRTPLTLGRRFELALCLETAEHLPGGTASQLVSNLTRLAPNLGPGYWRALFAADVEFPPVCVTAFRKWTRWRSGIVKKLLVFVAAHKVGRLSALFEAAPGPAPLGVVHPDLFSASGGILCGTPHLPARLERGFSSTHDELYAVQNSRPFRLYQRFRPAFDRTDHAITRLLKIKGEPWKYK